VPPFARFAVKPFYIINGFIPSARSGMFLGRRWWGFLHVALASRTDIYD